MSAMEGKASHVCSALAARLPRGLLLLVASLAAIFHAGAARAQHASDNPVASAEDAFGLTLGLESVGLYGAGGVRASVRRRPAMYGSTACTSISRARSPIA